MDGRKILEDADEGVTWQKKYFKYVPPRTVTNTRPMSTAILIFQVCVATHRKLTNTSSMSTTILIFQVCVATHRKLTNTSSMSTTRPTCQV